MPKNATSFMDLPAEMRNKVCQLVLISERSRDILTHSRCQCFAVKMRESVEQPALTRVVRSIRSETLPIFSGQNTFLLDFLGPDYRVQDIIRWLAAIGVCNRRLILHCRAEHYPRSPAPTFLLRELAKRCVQTNLWCFKPEGFHVYKYWAVGIANTHFMDEVEGVTQQARTARDASSR